MNGDTHKFAGKFSVKHLLERSPDRDFGFRYHQSRICGCPHSPPFAHSNPAAHEVLQQVDAASVGVEPSEILQVV